MIKYNLCISADNVNVPLQLEEKVIDNAITRMEEIDLRKFKNTLKSLREHFFPGNKDNTIYARMILFDLLTKSVGDLVHNKKKEELNGIANTIKKNILEIIKKSNSIEDNIKDNIKIEEEKLNNKRKKLFYLINSEISLVDDFVIVKKTKKKENTDDFSDLDFNKSDIEDKKIEDKKEEPRDKKEEPQKKPNNNKSQNNNDRKSWIFSFFNWK